jgi:ribosome recycling factor
VIDETLLEAEEKMEKAVSVAREDFTSIRTGRATPSMFNKVLVDYYGAPTPVNQLASFHVADPRMLTLTPFDKGSMAAIEKAIRDSDLGLNPSNDGNVMRLSVPELTEERRRDLVRMARHIAEEGRIGIRNVRRDIMHDLRELKGEGEIGEDDEKRAEAELQKLTDEKVHELDGLLKQKEADILEV